MNLKIALQNLIRFIHLSLAILWIYQGLVPKTLFQAQDELRIWQLQGFDQPLALGLMQCSGVIEIIFGCLFLILQHSALLHYLNILGMAILSLLMIAVDPLYFSQALILLS